MMDKPKERTGKWGNVSILNNTLNEIEKLIPRIYGFHSIAEYVAAAVRDKLRSDIARLQMEEDREKYGE